MKLLHGVSNVTVKGKNFYGVTEIEIEKEGGSPSVTYFLGHPYALKKDKAQYFTITVTAHLNDENLYSLEYLNKGLRGNVLGVGAREGVTEEFKFTLLEEDGTSHIVNFETVQLASIDFEGSFETDSDSVEPAMIKITLISAEPPNLN